MASSNTLLDSATFIYTCTISMQGTAMLVQAEHWQLGYECTSTTVNTAYKMALRVYGTYMTYSLHGYFKITLVKVIQHIPFPN